MSITADQLDHFRKALKGEALRLTTQRRAILEDILESTEHREIDDIYFSLKSRGIPVSRATIYRTLDVLEQVDFVLKMDIGDGRYRYENNLASSRTGAPRAHHDHMICEGCGKIIEFVDHQIERRQEKIAAEHNFKLLRHSHQLYGLCSDCAESQ